MKGVVLSGGQSSRMGTDKGLMIHNDQYWAEIALNKLAGLGIPSGVSVSASQKSAYGVLPAYTVLYTDQSVLDVHGPLLGVLSAHVCFPEEDLFILACDLLLISHEELEQLYQVYREKPQYEAFIFTKKDEPEPLCGVYTSKGLKKIKTLLDEGGLIRHSMKFVLSRLAVYKIPLTAENQLHFKNFNDPSALAG